MRFASIEVACVVALALVALANGLLWMFSIPFNEAPDEAAHFQVVRFIRDYGRLPTFSPDELWLISTPKGAVETYATFPPLAYVAAALASLPFSDEPLWGARLVSLASYVGAVVLTFAIARTLRTDLSVAVCAALIVAFLPQSAFVGAYVNNDALAVLESGVLYYLLARLYHPRRFSRPVGEDKAPSAGLDSLGHPTSALALVMIGLVIGALLLTKYTFYAAAGVGLVAALVLVRRPFQLVALAGGVVASAGWWFIRNYQLYGEAMPSTLIAEAKAAAGGNILFVPSEYGIDLLSLSTRTDFWWATFTSFVGKFGWLTIELHPAYYLACLALAALAAVGLGARLVRSGRAETDAARSQRTVPSRSGSPIREAVLVGIAVVVSTIVAAMATNAYGEYSPQGRYLFAALIPIAIALAAGWSGLALIAPWLRIVPLAATLAIVVLNFVSLLGYVVPSHFTGVERIVIQVDSALVSPDESTDIAGWGFLEGVSSWRPYAPGAIRDYRAPLREPTAYAGSPPPSGTPAHLYYDLERPDVADFFGGFTSLERIGYILRLQAGERADPSPAVFLCSAGARSRNECVLTHSPP